MKIEIPEPSLVVLIGATGSGKSTFAAKHFAPTEVLSSDRCRAMVSDDETDQRVSGDAFEVLHLLAKKRLRNRRLTVIDATNVQREARGALIEVAKEQHASADAIVLDVSAEVCLARNESRPDRDFGPHVVHLHRAQLTESLRGLEQEGFRRVYVLDGVTAIDGATVTRTKLASDEREQKGPFDLIGDVHGCADELRELLSRLGYSEDGSHPEDRRVIFLGDLVDRGPRIAEVLRVAMRMVDGGRALCVMGNHEAKLLRWLRGDAPKRSHGLAESIEQLERESESFRAEVRSFIDSRISHYVLDDGRLVVAHAGLKEELHGRTSGRVRQFCLYGDTTGETDDLGLPVRLDWAREYRGNAAVVYGHTPVATSRWVNGTICLDTGCVFGGKLTALRWPERELVSVDAKAVHYQPLRPLATEPTRDRYDLGLDDVRSGRAIESRYGMEVSVREESAAAALEAMSRFAIDPRWLVYLPPAMSPPETSSAEGFLEHPHEAFAYYAERGVREVVCRDMHTGSRAVLVVCRDEGVGLARFGDERLGVVTTCEGRPFFDDADLERALLERVRDASERAGTFDSLRSGWMILDAELAPRSVNATGLSVEQYARIGAAGMAVFSAALDALRAAPSARALLERTEARAERLRRYVEVYQRHGRPGSTVADLALAPFHLLASEGAVHVERDRAWHMETLAAICDQGDALLVATPWHRVDLRDQAAKRAATARWLEHTDAGGEGMVVAPLGWLERAEGRMVQPALGVRGRESLRLIYGPEYDAPKILGRIRKRSVRGLWRLAIREYALGLEGLARFVDGEPLHRVHECAFGVLALKSVALDPRL